jgi:hypothetical protein
MLMGKVVEHTLTEQTVCNAQAPGDGGLHRRTLWLMPGGWGDEV